MDDDLLLLLLLPPPTTRALTQCASGSGSSSDNTPVIQPILRLKKELAQMQGYDNYPQVSLARKMVRRQ